MHSQDSPSPPRLLVGFIVLFGVLLPFIALGYVAGNDFLRDSPFNPVPNALYILMVALVPVTNSFVAVALWRGETTVSRPIGWLHSIAIGVALAYALHLAPLTPIAVVLLLSSSIASLPLSPLLALIAASLGRRRLRGMPPLWAGLVMGVTALLIADLPAVSTRIGLRMAMSPVPGVQHAGLFVVRHLGSDEVLGWTCESDLTAQLGAPGAQTVNLLLPVSKEQAKQAYQAIKGKPYYRLP